MKVVLLLSRLIVLSVFMFSACTTAEDPDLPDQEYYIKFKAAGVEKKFDMLPNTFASFIYFDEFGFYGCTISGLKAGSDGTKDFINIQIRNETPYEPNQTYQLQESITVNSVKMSKMIFSYFDQDGTGYLATLLNESYPTLNINDDAQVRFTEINSTFVKGTFTARTYRVDATVITNREEMLITAGEFVLPHIDAENFK